MQVVRPADVTPEPFSSDLFTGPVTRQPVAPASKEFNVSIISFGRGVRNKLHTHEGDQVLIVTAGRGVVATEGERQEVAVGDVILIPARESHWHGATDDSDFSHIAVNRSGTKTVQIEQ